MPFAPLDPEIAKLPGVFTTAAQWNDWRWQLRSRIRTLDELARIFRLSEDEYAAVSRHKGSKATSSNRRLTVFKRYFRWALREHLLHSVRSVS